jgi:hypothetical protein
MPLKIVADELGRSTICLDSEPDWIIPLKIAPEHIEEYLLKGKWLILSLSVWNIHDWVTVGNAIFQAKRFNGRIKLGLRPFDYFEEHETWVPNFKNYLHPDSGKLLISSSADQSSISIRPVPNLSPILITMIEGELAKFKQGQLNNLEMSRYCKELLLS